MLPLCLLAGWIDQAKFYPCTSQVWPPCERHVAKLTLALEEKQIQSVNAVAGTQLPNTFIVAFFKQQNQAPASRQDWPLRQKGSLCHHHSAAAAAAAVHWASRT